MLEMHIRYNANIDNKTYVGERDLQKVIGCLLTYGNQFMELVVCQFRWQEQFHGIPWNFECTNFDDTSSSMEFHGTRSKPISLTQAVPWNSMELWVRQFRWLEQFHGIPWNSMELKVRQFRWHEQFHGIPWNLKCANFADRSSSMEFHGT